MWQLICLSLNLKGLHTNAALTIHVGQTCLEFEYDNILYTVTVYIYVTMCGGYFVAYLLPICPLWLLV